MFSIFRKKSYAVDLSILGADMHSHLLPGIDDGSQDTDTSLELIRGLRDLGYSRLVTTPHILWDMYKNDATSSECMNSRSGFPEPHNVTVGAAFCFAS